MNTAYHHLRRIDQAVVQSRNLARPESVCPMRFFQLTSKTRVAVVHPSDPEETLLEVTGQKGTVLQEFDRLALGVQQVLHSLDDFIAMGQEELEKLDMCLKRHLAETRSG